MQGERVFYACVGIFVVTVLGLATAYGVAVHKARRTKAALASRRERKRTASAYDPANRDPLVVKNRILNLWKQALESEKVVKSTIASFHEPEP